MLSKLRNNLSYSLIFSLVLALITERQIFSDPTAINNDVRNQIYWMAKFINPNYFNADYIASYFCQPSMISPVFSLIYQIGSLIADPKQVSQFLPFPIILITTYYLFKFTALHKDSRYAFWICACFNLYSWTMKFTAGGLPRSSFYLLLFMFLYYYSARKPLLALGSTVLAALCYPTTCFTMMIVLAVDKLYRKNFDKLSLATTAAGSLTLAYRYLWHRNHGYGNLITLSDILKLPECFLDGRRCIIMLPYSYTKNLELSQLAIILGTIITVIIIIAAVNHYLKTQNIKQPELLWTSAYVSIALFITAHFVLLYMYLPHRYIAYTLPLVPVFLIASSFYYLEQKQQKLALYTAVSITLIIMASQTDSDLRGLSQAEQGVLKYLSQTPIQSMIAAPLDFASNIPTYSYRSVLASNETDIPFHQGYHATMQARIKDLKQTYQNPEKLKTFIQKYQIDYIVLDQREAHNISSLKSCIEYNNSRFKVLNARCLAN